MARMNVRTTAVGLVLSCALVACSGAHGLVPASSSPQSLHRPDAAPNCAGYTPYSGSGGVPISFTNNSGLTPQAYLYVNAGGQYLNTNGKLTALPVGAASTYEFPMSCFTGKGSKQFILPPGSSFRIYVSFGTLTIPSDGIPACCEPPNVPTGFKNPNYGILWDLIEYTYPAGSGINIDTTQVDSFALPFMLSVRTGGKTESVGTSNYAKIINAIKASAPWNTLIVNGVVGGVKMPLRVMSPNDATTEAGSPGMPFNKSFPQDYFTSPKYYKGTNGYLGALLDYYSTGNTPKKPLYHQLVYVAYQAAFDGQSGCNSRPGGGGATICPTYYAYSDGKSKFYFALATVPKGSTATFPKLVTIPIGDLGEVNGINGVWGIPFGLPANPTIDQQMQFYMYKALAADLNRGVAMQRGYHGIAPCSKASTPPNGCAAYFTQPAIPLGNNYYHSPNLTSKEASIFSGYADILHANFVGGLSYAQSYDDFWTQSSDIATSAAPTSVNLTIESMKL